MGTEHREVERHHRRLVSCGTFGDFAQATPKKFRDAQYERKHQIRTNKVHHHHKSMMSALKSPEVFVTSSFPQTYVYNCMYTIVYIYIIII